MGALIDRHGFRWPGLLLIATMELVVGEAALEKSASSSSSEDESISENDAFSGSGEEDEDDESWPEDSREHDETGELDGSSGSLRERALDCSRTVHVGAWSGRRARAG